MKFFLVLYFAGGLNGGTVATSIGPYDDQPSCDIALKYSAKDGWKGFCYPIGHIEIKQQEAPKTK